jgi:decaprenylphospho-beta-D-ribofuranose 2-oxidase
MSRWAERELSGWGRVHRARCLAARPERQTDLAAVFPSEGPLLAFGAGRSYGDVALNSGGRAVITTRLDRLLSFDRDTGPAHRGAGSHLSAPCSPPSCRWASPRR